MIRKISAPNLLKLWKYKVTSASNIWLWCKELIVYGEREMPRWMKITHQNAKWKQANDNDMQWTNPEGNIEKVSFVEILNNEVPSIGKLVTIYCVDQIANSKNPLP
eukprot:296768_1